jgi:hypothetical protein
VSMDKHTTGHGGGHSADSPGHEERDVNFRPILWAGFGMLAIVVLTFVLVRWTYDAYMAHDAAASPPANPLTSRYGRQVPPEPRLQTHAVRDLGDLRALEDATLSSYGWVDRKAGVVRIPITRAMELLAKRGLPAVPETGGRQ